MRMYSFRDKAVELNRDGLARMVPDRRDDSRLAVACAAAAAFASAAAAAASAFDADELGRRVRYGLALEAWLLRVAAHLSFVQALPAC